MQSTTARLEPGRAHQHRNVAGGHLGAARGKRSSRQVCCDYPTDVQTLQSRLEGGVAIAGSAAQNAARWPSRLRSVRLGSVPSHHPAAMRS
eukprot:scaffold98195_cov28-Tisochrysis_lutea.AAC.1